MSLLPYALRPKVVLRSQIVKRGIIGGNPFLRPIAMMIVGQSVYLRRSALRQGLILGHPFWRVIGLALVGQELYRRGVKKAPERIAVERIGSSHRVSVEVFEPNLDLSRRQRRAELRRLESEALASVEARTTS
ncbi:MAG TPA: hypothetical protein VMY16_02555 [Ilumatobacteraceae bacterium]|nr:hypothetical protein [Ilumatobacteraceae bacterium]